MSLLPISALRVRSNPGGVRKSSYKNQSRILVGDKTQTPHHCKLWCFTPEGNAFNWSRQRTTLLLHWLLLHRKKPLSSFLQLRKRQTHSCSCRCRRRRHFMSRQKHPVCIPRLNYSSESWRCGSLGWFL